MARGLVFSIEEFSVFDGPGIRTTVFLMGCPLRCSWCHSPEGQGFENFILRSPNGCTDCKSCLKYAVCGENGITYTQQSIDNCPANLLRYCAVETSAEELCKKLERNFAILNSSGGGVTFSGGEPTAQPEFLKECLTLLGGRVSRAVQTCGACDEVTFSAILDKCDYMLFDLKLINSADHIKYTQADNRLIIENFKALAGSGKDFVIRSPMIPGVTDTEKNVRQMADLLSRYGVGYIELLPYNKLAGAKYPLAGKEYKPMFDPNATVELRTDILADYGIRTKIL